VPGNDDVTGSVAVSVHDVAVVGIAAPSMLVGVILVIYGGNQISGVVGVVGIYLGSAVLTDALGFALTGALLLIATRVFDRKQL
jgi:hypothetical protein